MELLTAYFRFSIFSRILSIFTGYYRTRDERKKKEKNMTNLSAADSCYWNETLAFAKNEMYKI